MRYLLPFSVMIIICAVVGAGCISRAPTDEPVRLAMDALLQTEEFTQEERDAVKSISVHNNIATVWLHKDFTDDGTKISEISKHVSSIFAEEFWNVAKEYKYREPRYVVYIYMKITDSDGTKKVNPCDAWWDLNKNKLVVEEHGFGAIVEIR